MKKKTTRQELEEFYDEILDDTTITQEGMMSALEVLKLNALLDISDTLNKISHSLETRLFV